MDELKEELGLPHSENTLAMLVNVHIVGGCKDLALHLQGLTLRVGVMQELIRLMRGSGYPGYEEDGVNSPQCVEQRLEDRYRKKYGHAAFTPAAVQAAVRVIDRANGSIVQEKPATPAEAPNDVKT